MMVRAAATAWQIDPTPFENPKLQKTGGEVLIVEKTAIESNEIIHPENLSNLRVSRSGIPLQRPI